MEYSARTLEKTLQTLTPAGAMRMIGLAGNGRELETLIDKLARNFGASVPTATRAILRDACKRWNAVPRHRNVSYSHD